MLFALLFSAHASDPHLSKIFHELSERHDQPIALELWGGVRPHTTTVPESLEQTGSLAGDVEAALAHYNEVTDCDQYRFDPTTTPPSIRVTHHPDENGDCVEYESAMDIPLTEPGHLRVKTGLMSLWSSSVGINIATPKVESFIEVCDPEVATCPTPMALLERIMTGLDDHVWTVTARAEGTAILVRPWKPLPPPPGDITPRRVSGEDIRPEIGLARAWGTETAAAKGVPEAVLQSMLDALDADGRAEGELVTDDQWRMFRTILWYPNEAPPLPPPPPTRPPPDPNARPTLYDAWERAKPIYAKGLVKGDLGRRFTDALFFDEQRPNGALVTDEQWDMLREIEALDSE